MAPPSPLQPPPLAPLFPPPSSVRPCSHWTGYTNEDWDTPLSHPHLYLRGNGKGPFDPPPPFSRKGGMGAGTVAPFTPSSRPGEPPPFSLLRAPLCLFTRNRSAGKDASGDHAGPDPPPFAPPPQFAREWGAGGTPCPPSEHVTPSPSLPQSCGMGAHEGMPPLFAPGPSFLGRAVLEVHVGAPPLPREREDRAGTPLSPLTPVFAQMAPAPPLPLQCAEATRERTGRGMGGGAHARTVSAQGRHVNEGQGARGMARAHPAMLGGSP
ncbi:hypothetical protein EDB85DRAFT_1899778 [Lactarius pseudohatsudake]|nr:hypothetical protein EDB85DRAFT_1899778 [Lactarius pseudohatsudake]